MKGEATIQREIKLALVSAGCIVSKNPAAPGQILGRPDLTVWCPDGRTIEMEVKRADGTLSHRQAALHEELRQLGIVVAVVRSVEDALNLVEK